MRSLFFVFLFILSFHSFAKDCLDQRPIKKYVPKYAKLFSIATYENFQLVEIEGGQEIIEKDRFIISSGKLECKTTLPVFTTAIKKFAATSTTYLYSLKILDKEDTLVAFAGTSHISSPFLRAKKISNLGYKLNKEELIKIGPDLIMVYQDNLANSRDLKSLRKLNIPVVVNRDYEEAHPLGRAEWLVLTSALFGVMEKGIAFFEEQEKVYTMLRDRIQKLPRKKVLVGDIQNGTWAMPGGEGNLGVLIRDAGGEMLFRRPVKQTQFLSTEIVISTKEKADFWFPHNLWENMSVPKNDMRYKIFSSVKSFNNNNKMTASGGNDFWEEGLARPELLLKDLVKIFYPEVERDHQLIWYRELK